MYCRPGFGATNPFSGTGAPLPLNLNPTSARPTGTFAPGAIPVYAAPFAFLPAPSLAQPRVTQYVIATGVPYETDVDAKGVRRWYWNGKTFLTAEGMKAAMAKAPAAGPGVSVLPPPPPFTGGGNTGPTILPPPPIVGTLPPGGPDLLTVTAPPSGGGGGGGPVLLDGSDAGVVPPDTPLGFHFDGKALAALGAVGLGLLWLSGMTSRRRKGRR